MQRAYGFTIVELLIVIVVIAILGAITVASYRGVQDRARATVIVSGIKSMDNAMRLALMENGATEWWDDDLYLDDDGEPAVTALIRGTNLKYYLPEVPRVGNEDSSFWMYDNDGPNDEAEGVDHVYDPTVCPQSHRSSGVNIQIELRNHARLAQQIDSMLDDGNLECGKFREHHRNEGEFLWLLAPNWREVN